MTEPPTRADWTLGVLCGGLSRRMGRDKLLLPWGAGTLLEHVVARCRPEPPGAVILAAGADRVLPGALADLPRVPDAEPESGPLAGILALRRAAAQPYLVVVPGDMPFLDRALLEHLVAAARRLGVLEAHFERGGRPEPLPLVAGPCADLSLAAALGSGQNKLLGWAAASDRALVAFPEGLDARTFENLNTPEDLERHDDDARGERER